MDRALLVTRLAVEASQTSDPIRNQRCCTRKISEHDIGETGQLAVLGQRTLGNHEVGGLGRTEIRPAIADQNANFARFSGERLALAIAGLRAAIAGFVREA
jgi:hypothetical protein